MRILMHMRITRDDLYAQVWSEPATKLAKRFDVSSSYLARVCEGLNVPHPPRGYWARKAVGEKIPIPPLPPAGPGDPVEWEKGVGVPERLPALELPVPASKSAKNTAPRPTRHPLVTAWREFLEEASPNKLNYMVPRKKNVLDAFVTKPIIPSTADTLNALFIELEVRGHHVQLAVDHHHRPPVDIAQRVIRENQYSETADKWQPGRATVVSMREAIIGLTMFELTENMRVRRAASGRVVRIKDLPPVRRYAPQSPDETDETEDMATGRLVLRAYLPVHDASWTKEWTEASPGDLLTMATAIADALEQAAPDIATQLKAAKERARQRQEESEKQWRRYQAQERGRKHREAQKEAREQLRAIVDRWRRAISFEAFLTELSRRANALEDEEREALETKIEAARELMSGPDAIDRFLEWDPPPDDDTDADKELDEDEEQDNSDDDDLV
jgi:hypothetical protein